MWKRKFDSDIQKNRQPIRDPVKFQQLQAECFMLLQGPLFGPEAALSLTHELIRMEPNRAIPWLLRSQALGLLDRLPEALKAIEQALVIDPSDPQKWILKATHLKILGRVSESAEAMKKAQELL